MKGILKEELKRAFRNPRFLAAPIFALVVGLASGLSPAMHTAALPPIVALQEE
jgi:hypothetical protein